MDFETASLNGSQLLQQLQRTPAQYAADYAEETQQYHALVGEPPNAFM